MEAGREVNQPLFGGSPERCPVSDWSTEIGIPSVKVRIEMQHGDGAVLLRYRPQQRQRDGVVATEDDKSAAVGCESRCALLDLGDSLLEIERVGDNIPTVGNLLLAERFDILRRVLRPKQPGCFPHMGRAETSTRSITDTAVEGNSHNRDVGRGDLIEAG